MGKKRLKTEQLIILVLFLAVITLPGTLLFNDVGRRLPDDNRMAAPMPDLKKADGSFVTRTELENFFNDNIGFRISAPRLDTRITYEMFGIMLDSGKLMGENGNIFPGEDRRFPEMRAPHVLPKEELEENGRQIKAAADYFDSIDIPFLFITIPNKEEVYPELYPDTFIKRPEKSRMGQQVEWLKTNTNVDAYDMTEALREQAVNFDGMLWYETKDSEHWNYMGAWYGYLEIMNQLKNYNPDLKLLDINDFDISVKREPFTNRSETYTFHGLYNTVYTLDYKPGWGCEQIGNGFDPWMPDDQLKIAGFPKGGSYYHFYNGENEGTLVFFGDSYIYQFLLPYFSESFAHVYLFNIPTNYRIMRPILDLIGADFVVLEIVERMYINGKFQYMVEEFADEVPVLKYSDTPRRN